MVTAALDRRRAVLEFLNAWLTSDHDQLDASPHRYVGHPAYNIDRLKADLARFTFLLGRDTEATSSSRQPSRDRTDHDQLDKDYLHNAEESAPPACRHDPEGLPGLVRLR